MGQINTKKVFEALPNVKAIWITEDGNFHLTDRNGGEKVERSGTPQGKNDDEKAAEEAKAAELLAKYGAIPKGAEDVIKVIDEAESEEEVNYFLGKDANDNGRKTVKDAAEARIVSL